MPGFKIDRFVNLSETEKNEFSCSICQGIFSNPIVTNCCRQTFCEDCINDWLKTNNSCPYDEKELNGNQLTPAPRAMINFLGKLKIMCDHREKGCEEVQMLENLTKHLQSCRYNAKKCPKCLYVMKPDHDCIKSLMELNKKANEEIVELKTKCNFMTMSEEQMLRDLAELKLVKENLLKTIQDTSNAGDTKIPISSKYRYPEQARRDLANVINHYRDLTPIVDKYVFLEGNHKDLVCLNGTIPITYRRVVYNIPVSLWITDTHPYEAPICYVKPTQGMYIKVSKYVDVSGRIILPYLSEWKSNTSDLLTVIQIMATEFGETPPLYSRK